MCAMRWSDHLFVHGGSVRDSGTFQSRQIDMGTRGSIVYIRVRCVRLCPCVFAWSNTGHVECTATDRWVRVTRAALRNCFRVVVVRSAWWRVVYQSLLWRGAAEAHAVVSERRVARDSARVVSLFTPWCHTAVERTPSRVHAAGLSRACAGLANESTNLRISRYARTSLLRAPWHSLVIAVPPSPFFFFLANEFTVNVNVLRVT